MNIGSSRFKGHRLREAREARGLSIEQLRKIIGVSRRSISAYENEESIPRIEILSKIADTLRFPINFFVADFQDPELASVFYRSFASATKSDRKQNEYKLKWLKHIADYFSEYFDLPEVNVPQFDLPLYINEEIEEQIEKFSVSVREQFGLGLGIIPNIVQLLENNGVIIAKNNTHSDRIDAFSEWRSDSRPFIFLGSIKSAVRSRFDAAHELGHLVFHSKLDTETVEENIRIIEKQADKFASAFLMPERTFVNDFGYYLSFEKMVQLKQKWKISVAAMAMRAAQLNLITESQSRNFWVSYSRKGYRTKGEPLDDILISEQPKMLQECLKQLFNHNFVTLQELQMFLPYSTEDFAALVNVKPTDITAYSYEELPPLEIKSKAKIFKLN